MSRKTGVLFSYVLMAVQILSTMLFTPFLIRTLGQAEYGVYSLMLSITSYFVLFDLGVGTSVIRYMSKYASEGNMREGRKFFGVTTIYYLGIAFLALIVGLIVKSLIPKFFATGLTDAEIVLAQKLFSVTIISSAITLATSAFSNAIIGFEKFAVSKGVAIIMTLLKMVLSIIALYMGFDSMGMVVVNLLTTVLTAVIYVTYVIFKLKIVPVFKGISFSFIKEIVSYSSFVLLQLIASSIITMSPQVLLGAFASDSAAIIGVFSIGVQIIQYFKTVGTHFTSVLMPGLVRFSGQSNANELYEKELIRINRIIFMVLSLVWVVFAIFGKDFVILWAGEDNVGAYYVALLLMLPLLFSYSEGAGYQLLQALAKHKLPAVLQLLTALLSIPVMIMLIMWNALEGATLGCFITFTVCEAVVMNIMYKKQLGIRLTVLFKGMFKGTVPSLAVCAAFGVILKLSGIFGSGWAGFFFNCLLTVAVYGISMLTFGMNGDEKQMTFDTVKKMMRVLHIKVK